MTPTPSRLLSEKKNKRRTLSAQEKKTTLASEKKVRDEKYCSPAQKAAK